MNTYMHIYECIYAHISWGCGSVVIGREIAYRVKGLDSTTSPTQKNIYIYSIQWDSFMLQSFLTVFYSVSFVDTYFCSFGLNIGGRLWRLKQKSGEGQ